MDTEHDKTVETKEIPVTEMKRLGRLKWAHRLEAAGLAGVALASVAVAVLDFSGLLSSTFLADRLGSMTLLIVGLVAGYLVLERRGVIDKAVESLTLLHSSFRSLESTVVSLENTALRTAAFFEASTGDRFSELRLLYGLRNFGTSVSSCEIKTGTDQVFSLWAESLREARSFLAFNYVSPDEVWGTKGWAFNVAHAAQVARLRLGCTIKRVFVLDTEDEQRALVELMLSQAAEGIEVKWILKRDVAANPVVNQYLIELGTWDFVLIDTDLLFRVTLDGNRHMTGCSLMKTRDLYQKALHAFWEAMQSGHSPKRSHALGHGGGIHEK